MKMNQLFDKAVNLYIKKHQMYNHSFVEFLNEKVVLTSFQMDCIKEKINQHNAKERLQKADIEFYFHCTAAVQSKGRISNLSREQIEKFYLIKFKTSKKSKGNNTNSQKQSQNNQGSETMSQVMKNISDQKKYPNHAKKQSVMKNKQKAVQYQQIQNDEHQVVRQQSLFKKQQSSEDLSPRKSQSQFPSIIKSPEFKVMHSIKEQSGSYRQSEEILNPDQSESYKENQEDQDQGIYMQPAQENQNKDKETYKEPPKVIQINEKQVRYQQSNKKSQKNQLKGQSRKQKQQEPNIKQHSKKFNQKQKMQINQVKEQVIKQRRESQNKQQKKASEKNNKPNIQIPNQEKKPRKISYNDNDSPRTINEVRKAKGLGQGSNQMNIISMGDTSQYNMDSTTNMESTVCITQYEKINQDFINVVIKYQIVYNEIKVWRRYSEFQKLMKYLNNKYQGNILPQMPPKEGIKGNLSYFLGPDEQFLRDRKEKLQILLKRLITCKKVYRDQILFRFLTSQVFEVDSASQGMSFSLSSIKDIALGFNAREIKDYGIAYYKYMAESKITLNRDIQDLHEEIEKMVQSFSFINDYRIKINENFKKRKDLLRLAGFICNKKQGSEFDQIIKQTHDQINDLKTQFKRYAYLKSEQSWIKMLSQQKEDKTEYEQKSVQHKERIIKMEKNLLDSMQQFKEQKQKVLDQINIKMYYWRSIVHP